MHDAQVITTAELIIEDFGLLLQLLFWHASDDSVDLTVELVHLGGIRLQDLNA